MAFCGQTIPSVAEPFQPLENVTRCTFLPLLVGTFPPNNALCDLLALSPQLGGLRIFNPSEQCDHEYSTSVTISQPLTHYLAVRANLNQSL